MKERPFDMVGQEVLAILDGRKTQARRAVKHQAGAGLAFQNCHYGKNGDRLWVRETFSFHLCDGRDVESVHYRADCDCCPVDGRKIKPWKPYIFMPRKLSRITLEIVGVRVEKLNQISALDIQAEGMPPERNGDLLWYRQLWEDINGPGSWATNPYVWVIEFRKL